MAPVSPEVPRYECTRKEVSGDHANVDTVSSFGDDTTSERVAIYYGSASLFSVCIAVIVRYVTRDDVLALFSLITAMAATHLVKHLVDDIVRATKKIP